jgi:hypothetical protein
MSVIHLPVLAVGDDGGAGVILGGNIERSGAAVRAEAIGYTSAWFSWSTTLTKAGERRLAWALLVLEDRLGGRGR